VDALTGLQPKADHPARLVDMLIESGLRLADRELVLRESGHAEVPRIGYR
jgi:hypothetical protein